MSHDAEIPERKHLLCGMDPERDRQATEKIRTEAEPGEGSWKATIASIAILTVGHSISIEVPVGEGYGHFSQRLRMALAATKTTKSGKWSVLKGEDESVTVTKKNGGVVPAMVLTVKPVPRPEPIEEIKELGDPVATIAGDDSPEIPIFLEACLDPEFDAAELLQLAGRINTWRAAKQATDALLIGWMTEYPLAEIGIVPMRALWTAVHEMVCAKLMLERKVKRVGEILND